jgi:hypothetical protein
MTAYRWRESDREFAAGWDEAMDTAVDAVESVLYKKALSGDTIAMIFYLKGAPSSLSRQAEHQRDASAERS